MYLKTVGTYIRRSPYQAISATLVMTLTFFAISVFAMLTILSIRLISYFSSIPQISIFFQESVKKEEVEEIKKKLENTNKTASITYISKEEALKIYKKLNEADDPLLNELVTADILPASLEVRATRPEHLTDLVSVVKDSPHVYKIVFQKDIVDTLISYVNAFKIVGFSVIVVLVIVSIFVILTIIGIKITVRREEIETLKLIGASNWFIRFPFILEGIFYGVVGALIGYIITFGAMLYVTPMLQSFLRGVSIFPIGPIILLELLLVVVLSAAFLGAFASYLAVLRYLK